MRRFWSNIGVVADGTTPAQLHHLARLARAYFATLHRIYLIGISPGGYGPAADRLGAVSGRQLAGIEALLRQTARVYAARARRADDEAQIGTGAAIAGRRAPTPRRRCSPRRTAACCARAASRPTPTS